MGVLRNAKLRVQVPSLPQYSHYSLKQFKVVGSVQSPRLMRSLKSYWAAQSAFACKTFSEVLRAFFYLCPKQIYEIDTVPRRLQPC